MRYMSMTLTGATGAQDSMLPFDGSIRYLRVAYTNGAGAGTLILTDKATGLTLLTRTNNTNIEGPLAKQVIGTDGEAVAGIVGSMPVSGYIRAAWASHNSNTSILVEIWLDEQ